MSNFIKPENALKRAEELLAIGNKNDALKTLHDIITAKRHRNWQNLGVLEAIMQKYLSLCVEMKNGDLAKDGLHHYKLACQHVNVSSLGVVIKHFLDTAEFHAREAQSKAEQLTLDDDLDEETPESLILSAVSGEDTKDRTDRAVVTPWLKFLWETYRTVLETLRNLPKLETLYQETAKKAFTFCLKYKRNTEFRRLSDLLRMHLTNLTQASVGNLNSPETLQIHLDTRFEQLNAATELELWQEALLSPRKWSTTTKSWRRYFGSLRTTCSIRMPGTSITL